MSEDKTPPPQTREEGWMRKCVECGKEFTSRNYNGMYCSTECRRTFNNRRMQRGAVLYDLAMIEGFAAEAFDKHDFAARREDLIAQWRKEDEGRRTWKPAHEVNFDLTSRR